MNAASPTAAADKLLPSRRPASGWIRLSRARELTWHDHRLAPPPNLPVGSSAPFALPLTVDGRSAVLRGSFTHVTRPRLWPWLLGVAMVVAALAATARAAPGNRGAIAAWAAAVAALAALASSTGFATGESITRPNLWLQVGSAAVLALGAVAVLHLRRQSARTWWAMVIGVIAAALSVGSVEVFWHGVVLSSLPPTLARLAIGAAVVGGIAATAIAILDDTSEPRRRKIAARTKAVPR